MACDLAAGNADDVTERKRIFSRSHLWILALIILFLVFRLPMFFDTRPPDQMAFAYIGQVIADGGRPYLDACDNKPPGVYLVNAFALSLVPFCIGAVAIVQIFWVFAFVGVAYLLARNLVGAFAAKWAAFLLVFSLGAKELVNSINMTETYALLPVSIGYVAFFAGQEEQIPSPRRLLLCGAFFAIATQFRPTTFLPLLALTFGVIWFFRDRTPLLQRTKQVAALWLGFALASCIFLLALGLLGMFSAYLETVVLANFYYVTASQSLPLQRILKPMTRSGPVMIFGLIGFLAALRSLRNTKLKILSFCLIWDLVGALSSPHWAAHYFVQLLIPSSILSAWVVCGAPNRALGAGGRSTTRTWFIPKGMLGWKGIVFSLLVMVGVFHQAKYFLEFHGQIADETSDLRSQWRAATYIRQTTDSADLILSHGHGTITGLYLLSHRKAASRHFHTHYVDGKKFRSSALVKKMSKEYLSEIRARIPKVVVLYAKQGVRFMPPYAGQFTTWLRRGYVLEKQIGPYEVWRYNGGGRFSSLKPA